MVYNIGSWALACKGAQLMFFQTRSAKTLVFAAKFLILQIYKQSVSKLLLIVYNTGSFV